MEDKYPSFGSQDKPEDTPLARDTHSLSHGRKTDNKSSDFDHLLCTMTTDYYHICFFEYH